MANGLLRPPLPVPPLSVVPGACCCRSSLPVCVGPVQPPPPPQHGASLSRCPFTPPLPALAAPVELFGLPPSAVCPCFSVCGPALVVMQIIHRLPVPSPPPPSPSLLLLSLLRTHHQSSPSGVCRSSFISLRLSLRWLQHCALPITTPTPQQQRQHRCPRRSTYSFYRGCMCT